MALKATDNQKKTMLVILGAIKSGDYDSLYTEFIHTKDEGKLAKNRDAFAGIACHCQKIFKKGGSKQLDEYFKYWLLETAKAFNAAKDPSQSDQLKEYQTKLALVKKACLLAADYDVISQKTVSMKNCHTPSEIREGKGSNLKDLGIYKWFLPRVKAPLGNAISLSFDDVSETGANA